MLSGASISSSDISYFYLQDEVKKCKGCHSTAKKKESISLPQLYSQNEGYLYKKLINFKYKYSKSRVMNRVTAKYLDSELKSIAKYFSKKPNTTPIPRKKVDTKLGKGIYENGIKGRAPACIKCHGGSNSERSETTPLLKYHHPMYLKKSIKKYARLKPGKANTASEMLMHYVVKDLTKEEIESISYYINELEN